MPGYLMYPCPVIYVEYRILLLSTAIRLHFLYVEKAGFDWHQFIQYERTLETVCTFAFRT